MDSKARLRLIDRWGESTPLRLTTPRQHISAVQELLRPILQPDNIQGDYVSEEDAVYDIGIELQECIQDFIMYYLVHGVKGALETKDLIAVMKREGIRILPVSPPLPSGSPEQGGQP